MLDLGDFNSLSSTAKKQTFLANRANAIIEI